MAGIVPADDLPGPMAAAGANAVPADDLPVAPAAAAPKTEEPKGWRDYTPLALGDAALAIGSNAVASTIGGLAGLRAADNPFVPEGTGGDVSQKVSQALTYEPRTQVGKTLTSAIAAPFEWLASKADKAGEYVREVTGSPAAATGTNVAVQSIPAIAGKGVSAVAQRMKPKAPVPGGYSATPDEAGAGLVTRTAANLSGEPKLAKTISGKNQELHNEKIVADLGLPPGTALDLETVKGVRKAAAKAYEDVRGTGRVTASAEYAKALDDLAAKFESVSKDFPELAASDAQAVINGARRQSFDANSAVDLINQLRLSADEAFAGRNAGMGKVYRGVADAVEAELGRHLNTQATMASIYGDQAAASAYGGMLQRFQAARERIAKAHLAQKALGEGDNINAQVYAKELAKDRPLTGGAREVGEFARDYPRSSLPPKQQAGAGGPTWSDAILTGLGTATGAATAGAAGAGAALPLLIARPAARAVIASGPYQRAFVRNPDAMRSTLATPEAAKALGLGPVPMLPLGQRPQEEAR